MITKILVAFKFYRRKSNFENNFSKILQKNKKNSIGIWKIFEKNWYKFQKIVIFAHPNGFFNNSVFFFQKYYFS